MLGVVCSAVLAYAQPEIVHPPGGGTPVEGLPVRMDFGGTGSTEASFVDGECVEVTTDLICKAGPSAGATCAANADCPGSICGVKRLQSAGDACGTGSGGGSPVPTQTPWDCGAGNGAQGMGTTPACYVRATPDGRGTECSTSSCNLNAATTLNSKQICLADGSNCPAGATTTTLTADSGGSTSGSSVGLLGTSTGIDTTTSGDDVTVSFDPTEIGTTTWGSGSNFTWTFNGSGATDPAIDVSTGAFIVSGSSVSLTTDGTNGVTLSGSPPVLAAAGTGSVRADDVVCSACISSGEIASGVIPTPVPTKTAAAYLQDSQTFTGDQTITGQFLASVSGGGRLSVDSVVGVSLANSANTKGVYFDATTGKFQKGSGGSVVADALSFSTPVVGSGTPQPVATSSAAPGSSADFARMDHVHVIADGSIGPAKLSFATFVPYATPTPIATPGSNPTMAAGQAYWANGYSGIVSEGATADQIEGWITFPDWASTDKTIAFPDASGTVCVSATSPLSLSAAGALSIPNAAADGATKGAVAFSSSNFDCTSGVCDVSTNILTASSGIDPSQLDRLAGDDDPRTFGNSDDAGFTWASSTNKFTLSVDTLPSSTTTAAFSVDLTTSPSANQQVFDVKSAGTQEFIVDVEGDVTAAGQVLCGGIATCQLKGGNSTVAFASQTVDATTASAVRLPYSAATPAPTPTAAGQMYCNTTTHKCSVGTGSGVFALSARYVMQWANGGAPSTSATNYTHGGNTPNSNEAPTAEPMAAGGVIVTLVCATNGDPTPGSYAVTFRKNGSDITGTCTLSAGSNPSTCSVDIGASFSAGDRLNLKIVPSSSPATVNLKCTALMEGVP